MTNENNTIFFYRSTFRTILFYLCLTGTTTKYQPVIVVLQNS